MVLSRITRLTFAVIRWWPKACETDPFPAIRDPLGLIVLCNHATVSISVYFVWIYVTFCLDRRSGAVTL